MPRQVPSRILNAVGRRSRVRALHKPFWLAAVVVCGSPACKRATSGEDGVETPAGPSSAAGGAVLAPQGRTAPSYLPPEALNLLQLECELAGRLIQSFPTDRFRASFVISPHAITRGLVALAASAGGETRDELIRILGTGLQEPLSWFEFSDRRYKSSSGQQVLVIGNSDADVDLLRQPNTGRLDGRSGIGLTDNADEQPWWRSAAGELALPRTADPGGGRLLAATLSFSSPFVHWKDSPTTPTPRNYADSEKQLRDGFCYSEMHAAYVDDAGVYGFIHRDAALQPILASPAETLGRVCSTLVQDGHLDLRSIGVLEPEFSIRSVTRLDAWLALEGAHRISDPQSAEWNVPSTSRAWLRAFVHPMSLQGTCYGFNTGGAPPAEPNNTLYNPSHVYVFERPFALAVRSPGTGAVMALAWIVPNQSVEEMK